ncbi:hypothetical protein AVEN_76598-1 [Araneus ventricosus]|uniref:Bulb-type lectin domain-containing protein n=1 Tax=Araneus ventricosus TaxID=182803 RepID=A0A4Y2MHT3_ARAVE|nr:hypothetical protein AVEN_76598-1 [Araneus ventricosus]
MADVPVPPNATAAGVPSDSVRNMTPCIVMEDDWSGRLQCHFLLSPGRRLCLRPPGAAVLWSAADMKGTGLSLLAGSENITLDSHNGICYWGTPSLYSIPMSNDCTPNSHRRLRISSPTHPLLSFFLYHSKTAGVASPKLSCILLKNFSFSIPPRG